MIATYTRMMTKQLAITVVRHGETTLNAQRLLQGHTDAPLSELGIEQATKLGKHKHESRIQFTKAFSSDLVRAYDTARLILQNSNHDQLEIKKDMRLRERSFGDAEGKPVVDVFEEAKTLGLKFYEYTPSGGETTEQVTNRVSQFFEELCGQLLEQNSDQEDSQNEHVLLVSHGGWILNFMRHLRANQDRFVIQNLDFEKGLAIPYNTGVSHFVVEKQPSTEKNQYCITFSKVNCTAHLDE